MGQFDKYIEDNMHVLKKGQEALKNAFDKLNPISSKAVDLNKKKVIASINVHGIVSFEFTDKVEAKKYFDSLKPCL